MDQFYRTVSYEMYTNDPTHGQSDRDWNYHGEKYNMGMLMFFPGVGAGIVGMAAEFQSRARRNVFSSMRAQLTANGGRIRTYGLFNNENIRDFGLEKVQFQTQAAIGLIKTDNSLNENEKILKISELLKQSELSVPTDGGRVMVAKSKSTLMERLLYQNEFKNDINISDTVRTIIEDYNVKDSVYKPLAEIQHTPGRAIIEKIHSKLPGGTQSWEVKVHFNIRTNMNDVHIVPRQSNNGSLLYIDKDRFSMKFSVPTFAGDMALTNPHLYSPNDALEIIRTNLEHNKYIINQTKIKPKYGIHNLGGRPKLETPSGSVMKHIQQDKIFNNLINSIDDTKHPDSIVANSMKRLEQQLNALFNVNSPISVFNADATLMTGSEAIDKGIPVLNMGKPYEMDDATKTGKRLVGAKINKSPNPSTQFNNFIDSLNVKNDNIVFEIHNYDGTTQPGPVSYVANTVSGSAQSLQSGNFFLVPARDGGQAAEARGKLIALRGKVYPSGNLTNIASKNYLKLLGNPDDLRESFYKQNKVNKTPIEYLSSSRAPRYVTMFHSGIFESDMGFTILPDGLHPEEGIISFKEAEQVLGTAETITNLQRDFVYNIKLNTQNGLVYTETPGRSSKTPKGTGVSNPKLSKQIEKKIGDANRHKSQVMNLTSAEAKFLGIKAHPLKGQKNIEVLFTQSNNGDIINLDIATHMESSLRIGGSKSEYKLQEYARYKKDIIQMIKEYEHTGDLTKVQQTALTDALNKFEVKGVLRNKELLKKAERIDFASGVFEHVLDNIIRKQYEFSKVKQHAGHIMNTKIGHLGTTKEIVFDSKKMQQFVNELASIMLQGGQPQSGVPQYIDKVVLSNAPNTPVRFKSTKKLDIHNLKLNLTTAENEFIYDSSSKGSKVRFLNIQKQIDHLQSKYFGGHVVRGSLIQDTQHLQNVKPTYLFHKNVPLWDTIISHSGASEGGKRKSLHYKNSISTEGWHGAGKLSLFNIMMMGDTGVDSIYSKYAREMIEVNQYRSFTSNMTASVYNSAFTEMQMASKPETAALYTKHKEVGRHFYDKLLEYTESMRFFRKKQGELAAVEGANIYDKAISEYINGVTSIDLFHGSPSSIAEESAKNTKIGEFIDTVLGLKEGFHFSDTQFNELQMFMENVPGVEQKSLGLSTNVLSLKLPMSMQVKHVSGSDMLPDKMDIIHMPRNIEGIPGEAALQQMQDNMQEGIMEKRFMRYQTLTKSGKETLNLGFLMGFANKLEQLKNTQEYKTNNEFKAKVDIGLVNTYGRVENKVGTIINEVGKGIRGSALKDSQKLRMPGSGGFTMISTRSMGGKFRQRKTIYMSESAFADQWKSMLGKTDIAANNLLTSNAIQEIIQQHDDKYLDNLKQSEKKYNKLGAVSKILQRATTENSKLPRGQRVPVGTLLKNILIKSFDGKDPSNVLRNKSANVVDLLSDTNMSLDRINKLTSFQVGENIGDPRTRNSLNNFLSNLRQISDPNFKDPLTLHTKLKQSVKDIQTNDKLSNLLRRMLKLKQGPNMSNKEINVLFKSLSLYVKEIGEIGNINNKRSINTNIRTLIKDRVIHHKFIKDKIEYRVKSQFRQNVQLLQKQTQDLLLIRDLGKQESAEQYAKSSIKALTKLSNDLIKSSSTNILDSKHRKSFVNIMGEYQKIIQESEEELIQSQHAKKAAKSGTLTNLIMRHPHNDAHAQMLVNIQLISGEFIERAKKEGASSDLIKSFQKSLSRKTLLVDPLEWAKQYGDFDGDIGYIFAQALDFKYGNAVTGSIITDNITEIMKDGLFLKEDNNIRPLNMATGAFMENLLGGESIHKNHELVSVKEWINDYARTMAKDQGRLNIDTTSEHDILKNVTNFVTREYNRFNKTNKEVNLDNIYYLKSSSSALVANKNQAVEFHIGNRKFQTKADNISVLPFLGIDISEDAIKVKEKVSHKKMLEQKYKTINSNVNLVKQEFRNQLERSVNKLAATKGQSENVMLVKEITGRVDKLNRTLNVLASSLLDAGPEAKSSALAAKQLAGGFTFATIQQPAIGGKHGFANISGSILDLFKQLQGGNMDTKRGMQLAKEHAEKWMSGYIDADILKDQADMFKNTGFSNITSFRNASKVNLKEIVAFHEAYSTIAEGVHTMIGQHGSVLPENTKIMQTMIKDVQGVFKKYKYLHNTDKNVYKFIDKSINYIQTEATHPLSETNLDLTSKIKAIAIESAKNAKDSQSNILRMTTGKYGAYAREGFMQTGRLFSEGKKIGIFDDIVHILGMLNSTDNLGYQTNDYIQTIQHLNEKFHNNQRLGNAMLKTLGATSPEFSALAMLRKSTKDVIAINKHKVRRTFDNLIKEGTLPKIAKVMVGVAAIGAFAPEPAVGTSVQATPHKNAEYLSKLPDKILKYNNNIAHVSHTPEWIKSKIERQRHEQYKYKQSIFQGLM